MQRHDVASTLRRRCIDAVISTDSKMNVFIYFFFHLQFYHTFTSKYVYFAYSVLTWPTSIYHRHGGSVVECPLCDREVAGSIPGRVIPKTLKMVLVALSLGAQH